MFFLSSYDHFQRKLIIIAKSQGFFPWLFSLSWEQRKLREVAVFNPKAELPDVFEYVDLESVVGTEMLSHRTETKHTAPSRAQRLAQTGDLFYQTVRPYQKNNYLFEKPDKHYVFSTGYAQMRPLVDSRFLLCLVQNNSFVKVVLDNCTGTSYPAINANDLAEIEVYVPRKEYEQQQIGAFIHSLDDLITLHQHEPLFLVMLFFGGSYIFKSAWEQRKLGDCFSERVESMPDGELISVTINDGIKKFSELGRHDNSNEDKSKYKKVCVGDIAYKSMRMWQGASGYSPYEGIVSPAYTVLTPNTGIISKCLAYQFKLPEMTHTFQIHSQGITSDNWNLKYPTLSEIKIFVSPDEKEQEQIARFFTNLDNLITLHQRKGNLREKKSLDFAWEQRKFSEITYPAGEKNRDNLPLESYSITNENGFVPQNEKFENGGTMREADKRMYYIVSPQSFAYNPARINVGSIGYQNLDKNVIVSSLYEVFKTVDTVDDRFLWHWFKSSDFQKLIEQLQEGGVRLYFYYDKLCMGSIAMPSKEEQKHIGEFFDHLDNLITLHQREHKSNFRRKTNVKQSTRDRPFLLLLCSVDKGLQRGSGP